MPWTFLGPPRLAGGLAKRQQDIDQLIAKVDATFNACGDEFRRECFVQWKDSHYASGCLMFATAYYTALTLYRSAFMGKKSDMGVKTEKNLVKVLSSMNSHEWCCRAERVMEIPALNEMRKFTKKPLASFDDLPEDKLPKDAEQALPPAPAPIADEADADAVLESPSGTRAASGHVEAGSQGDLEDSLIAYILDILGPSPDSPVRAGSPRQEVRDGMPVQGAGVAAADTAQESEVCIERPIAGAVAAPAGLQETQQPPQVLQANSGAETGAESGHAIQEMQSSASSGSHRVGQFGVLMAPQEQPRTRTRQTPVKLTDRPEAQAPKNKKQRKKGEKTPEKEMPNPLAKFGARTAKIVD